MRRERLLNLDSPIEFNCAALARNVGWRGLLIDGNLRQVEDARAILPNRVEVAEAFLTLDNLDFIRSKFPQLGVLFHRRRWQ